MHQSQSARVVRAILTVRTQEDGPTGRSSFSTKHEPAGLLAALRAMIADGELVRHAAARGEILVGIGPKWSPANV